MTGGNELPKRTGFIGPQRPVSCELSVETMVRYVSALTMWASDPSSRSLNDKVALPAPGGENGPGAQIIRQPDERKPNTHKGIRMLGIVKWFDSKKGFGFIKPDEGYDIFVHASGIDGQGWRWLEKGQRVEFVIANNERGPQAEHVKVIPA